MYNYIYKSYNSSFESCIAGSEAVRVDATFSPGDFKAVTSRADPKPRSMPVFAGSEDTLAECSSKAVYSCPREGCIHVFQRVSALDKHLSFEKCSLRAEKLTLLDVAKVSYKSRLEEGIGNVPTLSTLPHQSDIPRVSTNEGWALKSTKKSYRFSDKQKLFLKEKFRIGQETGRKLDGDVAAREMRRARDANGKRLFKSSEFLTSQQVSSYFSRLSVSARQRDPDENSIEAAREELNFCSIRESIEEAYEDVEPQHPLVYEGYDLCAMQKKDTLKGLRVSTLQDICKHLDLDVPKPPSRFKKPYLTLLKEKISKCFCQK